MQIIKKEIKKGINLTVIPTDKFKTDYISVVFSLPVTHENAASSSLLPKVLQRGSKKYPTMKEISCALDDLYAADIYPRVSSRGETQLFGFAANYLKQRYSADGTEIEKGVCGILSEILFHPLTENGGFSAEYTESEKAQLCDKIAAQKNDKRRYALRRCEELMCKDEAYGIPTLGTLDDVKKITPASLFDFYKKVITDVPCEICYVGADDPEEITKTVSRIFDNVPPRAEARFECEVIREAGESKTFTEEAEIEQSKLTLGFRTGMALSDGEWQNFSVFIDLFGASPTSKLFMNVREKLSLCYYCSAMSDPIKGIMLVYSGIKAENKETAQAEILRQLEKVKNGEITDDELSNAKTGVINSYRSLSDSPSSLEGWYTGRRIAGISSTPEECIEKAKQVTREDIVKIAQNITLDTVYFLCAKGEEDE